MQSRQSRWMFRRRMLRLETSLALTVLALTCALSSAAAAASNSARTTSASRTLSLYAVPARKAFVNNADDRSRGEGHNPFGTYSGATVTPPTNEKDFGPFAGDEGEFSFKLYTDKTHESSAGSAIFICQYNFNTGSFCDASFELSGGSLTGKGPYNFSSSTFTLAILGGTNDYRNLTGEMHLDALGIDTQPQPAVRAVPMIQQLHLTANLTTPASKVPSELTEYSTPTHENFVDNNDDEARGDVNNPWGAHNTLGAAYKEYGRGPFPGDEAIFTFNTYTSSDLKGKAGSALYTCQYYFYKNGFCDAYFQLSGGTLTAAGVLNFNAQTVTLTVTGGTGIYSGKAGELNATPHGKGAQRLAFELT